MFLPHKGEIQQNIAKIARGRNTTKHNVFTAQDKIHQNIATIAQG